MKIEQLRILCEVVDQGFSMSRAADALDISQPNISKQMRLLEEYLAVELLLRRGGRIIGMTEPGQEVLKVARRIVLDAGSMKGIGEDYRRGDRGRRVRGNWPGGPPRPLHPCGVPWCFPCGSWGRLAAAA